MQLHREFQGSKDALRLASLPWSAPHDSTSCGHNIRGVHLRRQHRGVSNSEEFHIGSPSPHVSGAALQRFYTTIADAQCEAATFA
eukprot:9040269-Lingulodinium_polyedra.AAC.1